MNFQTMDENSWFNMFDNVVVVAVVVAFQIIFCAEMHVNNVFLFLKNYF